jgi:hypothetical protein
MYRGVVHRGTRHAVSDLVLAQVIDDDPPEDAGARLDLQPADQASGGDALHLNFI